MAQVNLGYCLYRGIGVKRNRDEAAKWFQKAAEAGDLKAQYYFGDCCYVGFGVPKERAIEGNWRMKKVCHRRVIFAYTLVD